MGKTNANQHNLLAFPLIFLSVTIDFDLSKGLLFLHIHLELNQIDGPTLISIRPLLVQSFNSELQMGGRKPGKDHTGVTSW